MPRDCWDPLQKQDQVRPTIAEALQHHGPALVEVVVPRQELSMPSTIALNQANGFGLFMLKAVLSGRGGVFCRPLVRRVELEGNKHQFSRALDLHGLSEYLRVNGQRGAEFFNGFPANAVDGLDYVACVE